jgi:hypothetical protein
MRATGKISLLLLTVLLSWNKVITYLLTYLQLFFLNVWIFNKIDEFFKKCLLYGVQTLQATRKFEHLTNFRDILRSYEMCVRANSKVNIKYLYPLA